MAVVIETTLGDMTVDLYTEERPTACLNFIKLCKIKYYNYNLFHTVSRGFIAQTGDPTGTRQGGESIFGVLEGPSKRYVVAETTPRIKHTKMGLVSFVCNEDHMLSSQFFFTLGADLTYLDNKHCVFGEVAEGLDVLEMINEAICCGEDRPYQDIRITHTVILDDPFPDPRRLPVPSRSPSPSAERLQNGRIPADEEINDTTGKSAVELSEMLAEKEAKARATILEMIGDIPDAEMAPPENVLFVCKLNPVTTDDDLEIIFGRFGKIKSCEVIRDRKTGDSLQYAFIEFEERKSCEDAYFKMDNVLIDDRRIHVDFSQSVSKVKWHGKGRGITHYDDRGNKMKNQQADLGKGKYKSENTDNRQNNKEYHDRKNGDSKANQSRDRDHSTRKSNNKGRSNSTSSNSCDERASRRSRSPKKSYRSRQRSYKDKKTYHTASKQESRSGSPGKQYRSSSGYQDKSEKRFKNSHRSNSESPDHRQRRKSPPPSRRSPSGSRPSSSKDYKNSAHKDRRYDPKKRIEGHSTRQNREKSNSKRNRSRSREKSREKGSKSRERENYSSSKEQKNYARNRSSSGSRHTRRRDENMRNTKSRKRNGRSNVSESDSENDEVRKSKKREKYEDGDRRKAKTVDEKKNKKRRDSESCDRDGRKKVRKRRSSISESSESESDNRHKKSKKKKKSRRYSDSDS